MANLFFDVAPDDEDDKRRLTWGFWLGSRRWRCGVCLVSYTPGTGL